MAHADPISTPPPPPAVELPPEMLRVDQELADIARSYSLILEVTPHNALPAWRSFCESGYERTPRFEYTSPPPHRVQLEERLAALDLDTAGPPAVVAMSREHARALREELTMLGHRFEPAFREASLRLYGGVEPELFTQALGILDGLREGEIYASEPMSVDATSFVARARDELAGYQVEAGELVGMCQIRSDVDGLLVSHGCLLVGESVWVSERRARALLAHEVGIHMVTYINAQKQPLRQLACGLAGYDELQEGLAVVAEFLVGGLTRMRLRLIASRVVAVQRMLEGWDFVAIFRELVERSRMPHHLCFKTVMRVCRGGGLTKDAVYLRGLSSLLRYLALGGPIGPLLVGKIGLAHVGAIGGLLAEGVLSPPSIVPWFLREDAASGRTQALRSGLGVVDLVERNTP